MGGCLSSRKDGIVFAVADWIEPGLDLAKAFQAERIPLLRFLLSQQALKKANLYRHQLGSGSIQDRLEKLVELRRQEGYETEWQPAPDGIGWFIKDFHCSLQRIAEEYPSVCEQELLLMRQTFPDCLIDRVNWRLEYGNCCGFQIKPTQGHD